jgi:hypothetical protein
MAYIGQLEGRHTLRTPDSIEKVIEEVFIFSVECHIFEVVLVGNGLPDLIFEFLRVENTPGSEHHLKALQLGGFWVCENVLPHGLEVLIQVLFGDLHEEFVGFDEKIEEVEQEVVMRASDFLLDGVIDIPDKIIPVEVLEAGLGGEVADLLELWCWGAVVLYSF